MREWLYNLRTQKGLSCKQMAERMHITEPYFWNIEQGNKQKKMDIPTAQAIARALEMPLVTIIEMEVDASGL